MAKRSRRRRSRGLGGPLGAAVSSPQDLYKEVAQCGGHFFDADTRRFFNSRVTRVFPVRSRNVTYFVEAFGGGRTPAPRMYRVGVFKNCKVQKLGAGIHGKTYKTSEKATKVARMIVAGLKKGSDY